jgi:hypothetical protein
MYISTLVADVQKVLLMLRVDHGEYRLAMLYNADLGAQTNWNLIVSSEWADKLGIPQATRVIARELHQGLSLENKSALSRVTVLKTDDPFVEEMMNLYPEIGDAAGVPLKQMTAGGVIEGGAFIFYLRPASKSEVATTE